MHYEVYENEAKILARSASKIFGSRSRRLKCLMARIALPYFSHQNALLTIKRRSPLRRQEGLRFKVRILKFDSKAIKDG